MREMNRTEFSRLKCNGPDADQPDLLRLRRENALQRSLFTILEEWPATDRPAFVSILRAVASSIDAAGPATVNAADELEQIVFPFASIEEDAPTFASILQDVRRLAQDGATWPEAWEDIEPAFNALATSWTAQERSRNFEAMLAAHASDTDAPVEPVGRYCQTPGGG